jgi:hypothetical protein
MFKFTCMAIGRKPQFLAMWLQYPSWLPKVRVIDD